MHRRDQDRFDRILEGVIHALPVRIRALLDEISLVVMDQPPPELLDELRHDGLLRNDDGTESDGSDLCGLHTGSGLIDRTIDDTGLLPDQVHLFRDGIVSLALEDDEPEDEETNEAADGSLNNPPVWEACDDDLVEEEIRITLLHEIGHHFGLEEEDLDDLGYA